MANSNNPFGFENNDGNDPFEEFFKKLSEGGANLPFDSNAFNNIDPEELKKMGIPMDPAMLSGIFAQVSNMMNASANSDEPVNWDLALQHARRVVATEPDPSVTVNQKSAVKDATQLADLWLDAATSFERPTFDTETWSKAEWTENSFDAWKEMSGPIAESLSESMNASISSQMPEEVAGLLGGNQGNLFSGVGSMMFGMQMGQAIGGLAQEVLSSTDIGIPLAPGRSALVPHGITAFGEGLEIPKQEIMLFIAVREAALTRLYKANSWLREDLIALIQRYARGIHVDIERMQDAASEIDPHNPEALQEALGSDIFTPQNTEDQKLALDRIETLLALIEGWVSVITEHATKNLPTTAQLTETMTRRRATGGPAEHVFAALVGLELRPRKIREAAQFWKDYTANHGLQERDALWNTPETLPTGEELDTPGAYEQRLEMLNASEDEFDAALEKLLSGGYDEDQPDESGKPDDQPKNPEEPK